MPRGILNKNIYVDGVWKTTEEIRNSLLGRNLPPPVTNTVIEGGLEAFQEQMGKVIFGLPNINESIPLDKESLEENETDNRDKLLNYNKYIIGDDRDEYNVVTPNIETEGRTNGDYSTQNFGLVGFTNQIGIQNPFNVIDAPRGTNFDSNLGNIASERLEFLLNERVSQSTINETTGRINTNVTSLLMGNEFIQRNYDITVPQTIIGKGVSLIGKLTGVELPISTIPNGAIGWQEYNQARANSGKLKNKVNNLLEKLGVGSQLGLSTEGRTEELLKSTGGGQKNSLFTHLNLNQYTPTYESPRLFGLLGDRGTNGRYYIGNENSTNRITSTITRRLTSEDFNNTDEGNELSTTIDSNYLWVTSGDTKFPDQTLLSKTSNIVDLFSKSDVFIDQTKKFFNEKRDGQVVDVSRGNAIKNNSGEYARVWLKSTEGTESDRLKKGYSYQNAIRKSGLFNKDKTKPGFSVDSGKASLSVLQSNGIVKTYPYLEESFTTYKKYMLSLENLAWSDDLADLPMQEIGPGDLVNGRKGRIMWFAPYDLSFDENISTQWNDVTFLGRGEPLFTYNNTQRTGTLKFKIVVDHPRIINEYRGRQDKELEKFFAGITTPEEFLDIIQDNTRLNTGTKKELEKKLNSIKRQSVSQTKEGKEFQVYFANDVGALPDNTYEKERNKIFLETEAGGKNSEIGKYLSRTDGKYRVIIIGHTSASASFDYNLKLSNERAKSVEDFLKGLNGNNNFEFEVRGVGETQSVSDENTPKDDESAIVDRRVDVYIDYTQTSEEGEKQKTGLDGFLDDDLKLLGNLFINESTYFDMITEDYPNYFDSISSKIKYFQPGFHSTTPEGLNTRLTFLQQCMRQGDSVYIDSKNRKADNLSFGRPPVLILRIGDFIHTKIIAKSLSIGYANGSNIQWDLNPEGVGVQPMVAEVSMTIEIIGGQSLQGPINRLQNAMSYNFYANTEMYDPRSDSIELNDGKGEIVDGVSLGEMREEAGLDINESLKNELPIDQEATRLKSEEVEQEALKLLGNIEINETNSDDEPSFTILSFTESSNEPISPAELVDGSGENKIKVVITNITDNTEVFNGFQTEKSWTIPLSVIGKERYKNASKMNDVRIDIIGKETEIEDEEADKNRKRVIKKLTKELDILKNTLETLVKDNTINFKISASFSRGEEINPKTKTYTYKWEDELWVEQ